VNTTPAGSPYYNDPTAAAAAVAPGQQTVRYDDAATAEARSDPALDVGGFGSYHIGGGSFALGDGSVRFISQNINTDVFQRLIDRADGAVGEDF